MPPARRRGGGGPRAAGRTAGVLLLALALAAPLAARESQAVEPPPESPAPSTEPAPGEAPAEEELPEEVGEDGEVEGERGDDGEADIDEGEGKEEEGEEVGEEGEEAIEDAGPRLDRITFELPFPRDKGGGTVTGSAGDLQFRREDVAALSGGVELEYRDLTIQAETVTVDLASKIATAEGEVILDEGPRRLSGATLTFDLEAKTGTLTEASAFVDPDMYFRGDTIEKTGEDTYRVTNGVFTSCRGDRPVWSFKAGKARVKVEGYATITHARMRLKNVPFFYTPYLLWPVKSERTSGLLTPNIGSSETRGSFLGLAYYQVFGDSYDSTFFVDLFEEGFLGIGNELRYAPSVFTTGRFEAYAIDDPVEDEVRWKMKWRHSAERLPFGFRGAVAYNDFSDFQFFQDFERDFNRISLRSLYSNAFASRNWGPHAFNVLVDQRETFISDDVVVEQRQLPEIEYSLRQVQIGNTPLFFQTRSSVHYFSIERTDALSAQYGRFDILPQLTLPFRPAPWLSLAFNGATRFTWWEDSLTEDGTDFSGESLTRSLGSAGAEIVGPSFSRIFNKGIGPFSKFKHVIEPRVNYLWVDDFEDSGLVPRFDEIDRTAGTRQVATFSLANRLLAKPRDESVGGAREIMSLEFSQSYSFDDEQPFQVSRDGEKTSQKSTIGMLYRFNPSARTSVQAQASYNTLFDELAAASLTGIWSLGASDFSLSWLARFDPEEGGETGTHQARFATAFDIVPRRLRLSANFTFDLNAPMDAPEIPNQRYLLQYSSQCYGLSLEFREFESVSRLERDVRFAVSFKNVGTFLDLTGGQSESLK